MNELIEGVQLENLGKCDNEWTRGRLKFIQLLKEVGKHSGLGKWDNGEIMEMG
jgi:hypothetical protein